MNKKTEHQLDINFKCRIFSANWVGIPFYLPEDFIQVYNLPEPIQSL